MEKLIEIEIKICENHVESDVTLCPNCHLDYDPWVHTPLTNEERQILALADVSDGGPF